ncbi:MAG: hypothetical protein LQ338_008036 [Usnochroma carphineum]|nr:MAG: hypothetical protein LQ338_008036 [Usnochroma carphineum]
MTLKALQEDPDTLGAGLRHLELDRIQDKEEHEQQRLRDLEAMRAEFEDSLQEVRAELEYTKEWRLIHDERDLKLFKANMLLVLLYALCKGTGKSTVGVEHKGVNDKDHAMGRYALAYTLFNEKDWEQTGLKRQVLSELKNLSKVTAERNNCAHQSNVDFAKLLTNQAFRKGPYQHEYDWWAPVFAYVYRDKHGRGLTLEECALLDERTLATFLPKGQDEQDENDDGAGKPT